MPSRFRGNRGHAQLKQPKESFSRPEPPPRGALGSRLFIPGRQPRAKASKGVPCLVSVDRGPASEADGIGNEIALRLKSGARIIQSRLRQRRGCFPHRGNLTKLMRLTLMR